jgi:uncharacterized membrane protein
MRRLLASALAYLATTGVALAHETGTVHEEPLLPSVVAPTVFLGGVLVLVTAVVLDHREMLGARETNAGVAVGVVGILAGIGLLFL